MMTCEVAPALRTWQRVQMSRRGSHPLQQRTKRRGSDLDPGLWIYRQRTAGLLHRYLRLSLEVGRLPSVLGREFFGARFTGLRKVSFEDAVIFVHGLERWRGQVARLSRQGPVWV